MVRRSRTFRTTSALVFLGTLLSLAAFQATAEDASTGHAPAIQGSVGALGRIDGFKYEARAGLDYIFSPKTEWQLKPSIGGMVTENGAYFIGVAIRRDFYLGDHWVVTPSFGPGVFEESRITRLGNELEFRSGLELGYRNDQDQRIGLVLQHLSNAGTGETNPGRETLSLYIQIPML